MSYNVKVLEPDEYIKYVILNNIDSVYDLFDVLKFEEKEDYNLLEIRYKVPLGCGKMDFCARLIKNNLPFKENINLHLKDIFKYLSHCTIGCSIDINDDEARYRYEQPNKFYKNNKSLYFKIHFNGIYKEVSFNLNDYISDEEVSKFNDDNYEIKNSIIPKFINPHLTYMVLEYLEKINKLKK